MTPGVVLIGDAAGWNVPIIGPGLAITLRDVRLLSEILTTSDDWSPSSFNPYVEQRCELLRRLRWVATLWAALFAEFGPNAAERRAKAFARMADDPTLEMALGAVFVGPDAHPPDLFTTERYNSVLNA